MEKRTLLAIGLSLLILFVYTYIFAPEPVPQQPEIQKPVEVKKETTPTPLPRKLPGEILLPDEADLDITVETDLYKAVLTNKGGVIKSWELKKYKDKDGNPIKLLKQPGSIPPLGLLLEGTQPEAGLSEEALRQYLPLNVLYQVNKRSLKLSKYREKGEITFTYSNNDLSIKKTLIFYNNDYRVDILVETDGVQSYLFPVGSDFGLSDKIADGHKGTVILIDADRKEFTAEKLNRPMDFTGNIRWIAQEDKYFTAAIAPIGKKAKATLSEDAHQVKGASVWKSGENAEVALRLGPTKNSFILYAGPKEYDRLRAINVGFEHIIDFGFFSIIAVPLFWVLKFFNSFLHNYGLAIIAITIVTKIPFIPLINKGQQVMKRMQALQPRIKELQEKYKKDKQRLNKELMELYKQQKVNPMGGCLPILLQIPIFIALYSILDTAIELRGAPFFWWIKDLSVKDPYYILPIVMGITMVIQQKMTPSSLDPTQNKIMMFLPIIFTFLFLSFPSGLVLYWLVNNILSIIQQFYINKTAS
ncbi:MAG TPA: protein translocase component YidC [Nitrospiraceae bacterium]|nr:protein translocase component YidC [Nitrospiraceae bacterium]